MRESAEVSFRSHALSTDQSTSIVFVTTLPVLGDGLLSLRLKGGMSPELVRGLITQLGEQVDQIEFHPVDKPKLEDA